MSFEEYFKNLKNIFPKIELEYYQSNVEGEIINKLHETGFTYDGIILNAGGYTHTSVAIADAIRSVSTQVIEVHISNIYERESFRHHTYTSAYAKECIVGKGLEGYKLAIQKIIEGD